MRRTNQEALTDQELAESCNRTLARIRHRIDQETQMGSNLFHFRHDNSQARAILKAVGLIKKPSSRVEWWVSTQGEVTAEQVSNYRLLIGLGLNPSYTLDTKLCDLLRKAKDVKRDLRAGLNELLRGL